MVIWRFAESKIHLFAKKLIFNDKLSKNLKWCFWGEKYFKKKLLKIWKILCVCVCIFVT
jgi:hypothetical protein